MLTLWSDESVARVADTELIGVVACCTILGTPPNCAKVLLGNHVKLKHWTENGTQGRTRGSCLLNTSEIDKIKIKRATQTLNADYLSYLGWTTAAPTWTIQADIVISQIRYKLGGWTSWKALIIDQSIREWAFQTRLSCALNAITDYRGANCAGVSVVLLNRSKTVSTAQLHWNALVKISTPWSAS